MKNYELSVLLKNLEIELRSLGKPSIVLHQRMAELSDWEIRIVQGFMVEVNLAIQRNDANYVFKKYEELLIKMPANKILKSEYQLDLLVCVCKRVQHDLALVDIPNRLMPAFNHPEVKWDFMEVWGLPVDRARNFCIEKALERKVRRILFIDDDMIVENTALNKIWDAMEQTGSICVAGEYQKKAVDASSAHGNKVEKAIYKQRLKKNKIKGYFTDLCAMGFTLIDLEKLTFKVPEPYFWVFLAPDGLWSMGEDAFFTKKLIEFTDEHPLVITNVSILHYDKRWKKCFGNRNKDITYATNKIDDFTTFDHIRVPPSHPLIAIAIPGRNEQEPICTNLQKLVLDRGYKSQLIRVLGKQVDVARNELATAAVQMESRYTLFIDNDIVMPRDAVSRMLEILENDTEEKIAAVTGDYLLKGIPSHSVHLHLDHEGKVQELSKLVTPMRVEANWLIGMGCCLIRTNVFRQIQFPWFKCHNLKQNDALAGGVNEDAHFTEMMMNNGYKVIIARDIKCLHIDTEHGMMYGWEKTVNVENYAYFPFISQLNYASMEEYEATKV